MRIKGSPSDIQLKQRLYFPGVYLYSVCTCCNKEIELILGKMNLTMVQTNRPFKIYFDCKECNKGWTEEIIISLVISNV